MHPNACGRPLLTCSALVANVWLSSAAVAAPPCTDAITPTTETELTTEVLDALGALGIAPATADATCEPFQVAIDVGPASTITVRLLSPAGEEEALAAPTAQAAAAWIASRLGAPEPTDATDPTVPDDRRVVVYPSFEAWRAQRPSGEAEAGLLVETIKLKLAPDVPPAQLYSVDLSIKDAKPLGKVFAFTSGGELYVNDEHPRPDRTVTFGKLERAGDRGVFLNRRCRWQPSTGTNPGSMVCVESVRVIDLDTGAIVVANKRALKRWLEAEPALRATFLELKPKNLALLADMTVRLLRARPDLTVQ